MKDGIIFVAGIYGVGKSTLCERLGLSIGIPCYSAGDLISALNGETYGRNKTVVNKEKNQDILVAAVNDRLQKDTAFILAGHFCIFDKSFNVARLLLCKQAAKNFHTICKKETALKRVLSNLLSAVSLLRFKAVFSCGFRVPPGSGLYQSCAAGSVCIPAGQKYCSPRPRKSCPADRKTPGLPSRCIGHRW